MPGNSTVSVVVISLVKEFPDKRYCDTLLNKQVFLSSVELNCFDHANMAKHNAVRQWSHIQKK